MYRMLLAGTGMADVGEEHGARSSAALSAGHRQSTSADMRLDVLADMCSGHEPGHRRGSAVETFIFNHVSGHEPYRYGPYSYGREMCPGHEPYSYGPYSYGREMCPGHEPGHCWGAAGETAGTTHAVPIRHGCPDTNEKWYWHRRSPCREEREVRLECHRQELTEEPRPTWSINKFYY